MDSKPPLMSHAAIVLPVNDINKSIAFYKEKLGFEITFEYGEPLYYAVAKRDETISIHLTTRNDKGVPSDKHNVLYVFTSDVEELYQEFVNSGVDIHHPLTTWEYGMRDFDIKDPDGHILSFGQGV